MMRFKKVVSFLPNRETAAMIYARITLSRLTLIYFLFSLAHCIIQVLFQGQAFQINMNAANLIDTILHVTNSSSTSREGFAIQLDGELVWCKGLPEDIVGGWGVGAGKGCSVIWNVNGGGGGTRVPNGGSAVPLISVGGTDASATAPILSTGVGPSVTALPSVVSNINNAFATVAPVSSSNSNTDIKPGPPSPNQVTVTRFVQAQPTPPSPDPDSNSFVGGSGLNVVDIRSPHAQPPHDPFLTSDPLVHDKRQPQPPHDPYLTTDPILHLHSPRSLKILVSTTESTDSFGETITTITGLPSGPRSITIDSTCLLALNWPLETLDNTKREDIVFVCFHLWVLGISIAGLLNESIPHILASLATHIIVTAWSAFQLANTRTFQYNFNRIITTGTCNGQNLLPTYWSDRANAEIPSAALNALALLISVYLTYKLIKTYSWATFKRIGANRTISKVYKAVLSLSVILQLGLFFIVVSMALWIDQLCNGVIGRFAKHMALYRGVYITVLLLLVPWIVIGWKAVRVENRPLMHAFLIFNVVLIGGWASMFASITFRWTFTQWKFFAIISVAAVILTLVTLVLGVICRRNFGSELGKYLNAQSRMEDDEEFVSATDDMIDEKSPSFLSSRSGPFGDRDSEKISFPSPGAAGIPTFGAAFSRNGSANSSNSGGTGGFGSVNYAPSYSSTSSGGGEEVVIAAPPFAHLPSRFSDSGDGGSVGTREREVERKRISGGSARSDGSTPSFASTQPETKKNGPSLSGLEQSSVSIGVGGRGRGKKFVIE